MARLQWPEAHDSMLNMGNGEHSMAQAHKLVQRMFEAFTTLGGTQQPRMSTEEPDPVDDMERAAGTWEVECFVRDVAMAFTGKEIEFK